MTNLSNSGPPSNGDLSAELFGGIRPRRRDRCGEIIDEPAIHGQYEPPIDRDDSPFPEYCKRYDVEAAVCRELSTDELEARADAARTELIRRRGTA